MERRFEKIFLTIFILCLSIDCVYGHESHRIHPEEITFEAEELLRDSFNSNEKNKYIEIIENISDGGYFDFIRQGSIDEDYEEYGTSPKNHFYNPYTGNGLNRPAPDWGEDLWQKAIELYGYTDKEKSAAYTMLGRAAHVLEDMSAPPHVFNDPHIITFGLAYEDEELSFADSLLGGGKVEEVGDEEFIKDLEGQFLVLNNAQKRGRPKKEAVSENK